MKDAIKDGYDRVSDISSAFAGYANIPRNILDYAADRGTLCHSLIYDSMNCIAIKEERYAFCGKNVKKIKDTDNESFIDSWEKFWNPLEDSPIILQEVRLYHDDLKLTGQVDLITKIDGKNMLIDWKATSKVGMHWIIQASGYRLLCDANGYDIDSIMFVKLDKDGKPPIITEYIPNLDLFHKALDLYRMFFKNLKCNLEMD